MILHGCSHRSSRSSRRTIARTCLENLTDGRRCRTTQHGNSLCDLRVKCEHGGGDMPHSHQDPLHEGSGKKANRDPET